MTEEKNELVGAFKSYEWIILHTNPLHNEIDLSFTIEPVPSYIREDVDLHKLKEWLFDKNKTPRDILFHQSINLLLSELVKKGIPLYKVDNKEITCVADIKRLWQETELDKNYYSFITDLSYTYKVLHARLTSQRLKIKKELMPKLYIEKQGKAPSKKIPRGQKQPYVNQNEFNGFMEKIIQENTGYSSVQIARKAKTIMKKENCFLDDNGEPLYKETTLKGIICKLKKDLKHTKPSFSKLKKDGKVTVKKRHLKSDVKT